VIQIDCSILDMPFDMVIGRPSIKTHGLTHKLPSHFSDTETESTDVAICQICTSPSASATAPGEDRLAILNLPARLKEYRETYEQSCPCQKPGRSFSIGSTRTAPVRQNRCHLAKESVDLEKQTQIKQTKDDLIFAAILDAEEQKSYMDSIPEEKDDPLASCRIPTNIHGSGDFQAKQRALFERYIDRFNTKLTREPAKVPALNLKVDETKWFHNKNREAPRPQSVAKQYVNSTSLVTNPPCSKTKQRNQILCRREKAQ
jgi:hypothetical protein